MSLFTRFGIMSQGGKPGRLFQSNASIVSELNIDTLASIRQVSKSNYTRIGGVKNRLYKAQSATSIVSEINVETFAIIVTNSNAIPLARMGDVGGIQSRLYVSWNGNSAENHGVNELNTETLAVVNSYPRAYATYRLDGLGGMSGRLFGYSNSGHMRELNPDNATVINAVSIGDTTAHLVDGINKRLLSVESGGSIKELNPDTLTIIATTASPLSASGLGGVKQ
jgi:hypothetical protein